MKKIAIGLMIFTIVLMAGSFMIYRIDMKRMSQNKDVLFSTWGREYTYPVFNEVIDNINNYIDSDEDVYAVVLQDSISSRGTNLVIVNDSGYDVVFVDYYDIEVKIDGEWVKLKYMEDIFRGYEDVSFIIQSGSEAEFNIYWEDLFGNLESGEYRVMLPYFYLLNTEEFFNLYFEFSILNTTILHFKILKHKIKI